MAFAALMLSACLPMAAPAKTLHDTASQAPGGPCMVAAEQDRSPGAANGEGSTSHRGGRSDAGDVVVTGTRTPRTRRDTPIRTDVIGSALLSRTAPRNLGDAIDFLPGARAENNCQNCNTTEIQLLGLPGSYNQILLDGLPLVTGVAAVYGVEQVPAVLVERIEVVKGGGSALYGPGAVAGVVNVIPLRPERDGLRATLDLQLPGGEAAFSSSIVGSKMLADGRGFVNAFAQAEESPAVDLNDDDYSELARRRLTTAGTRGEWQPGETTTIALDYQYTRERRRGGNRLDQPWFLSNITEAIDSTVHRGSVSVDQQLGEQTKMVGVFAFSDLQRKAFYGGLGDIVADPAAPGFDQDDFDAAVAVSRTQYSRTRDRFRFGEVRLESVQGRHALLGGIQYRWEGVRDLNTDVDDRVLGTIVEDDFSTLGAFVQDEWTLNEGLRLVLGGRIDKSSELDDVIVSPRVGLWASPTSSLVLRANYSTGYRAPEVFSEDVHIDVLGADPIRVRNADGLRQERADSYALGFDWRPAWSDGAFTLDGQAYLTRLSDTFFLGPIEQAPDGSLFRTRSNTGGSRVMGAEISTSYRLASSLRLLASGVYLDARYDDRQTVFEEEDEGIVLTTRRYLKSPQWSGVGQIAWDATPNLDVFAGLRYIGSMDVLNNRAGEIRRVDDFLVADLTATRHFALNADGSREVDLTLGVKNATNVRQRDLEVGASRDSTYVYGPRLPRTLFVRLSARY
jgi:outer membrane receptor for ferrienterochelin and colicins